jgi:Ca-activated chloride channel family protein
MIAVAVAAAVFALAAAAETLHLLRVRHVARLAFGPGRRPAVWARFAPQARVLALAALAWGLTTLLLIDPMIHKASEEIPDSEKRQVVIVLDVSPSMRLVDAGADGDLSRMHRARDVLNSLFERVGIRRKLVSVVATYNGAIPIVEQSRDPEVVRNILNDLPMHHAFRKGDTDLFAGLEEAARIAKPFNLDSTTLLLVSDGDTVPATGMPKMPASINHTLVIGVGNPREGTFIDGRHSRQEASMLRQIAIRLGGTYHDANESQVPTDLLSAVIAAGEPGSAERWTRREYALLATFLGALVLATLPHLLRQFGTRWAPGVPRRWDDRATIPVIHSHDRRHSGRAIECP